jgi:hypothetical protein
MVSTSARGGSKIDRAAEISDHCVCTPLWQGSRGAQQDTNSKTVARQSAKQVVADEARGTG